VHDAEKIHTVFLQCEAVPCARQSPTVARPVPCAEVGLRIPTRRPTLAEGAPTACAACPSVARGCHAPPHQGPPPRKAAPAYPPAAPNKRRPAPLHSGRTRPGWPTGALPFFFAPLWPTGSATHAAAIGSGYSSGFQTRSAPLRGTPNTAVGAVWEGPLSPPGGGRPQTRPRCGHVRRGGQARAVTNAVCRWGGC